MTDFTGRNLVRATRDDLMGLPLEVAPRLLGGVLRTHLDDGDVALRITEVEAYHGRGTGDIPDPASHARMGWTPRNATMWGAPGHLYVYFSHGIHSCVNVVCGPEGTGGGVLLRAGEVIEGEEVARERRLERYRSRSEPQPKMLHRDLARGPGRFGQASGLRHPIDDGVDAIDGPLAQLWLPGTPLEEVATGPRVGVAGVAGTDEYPWRFWIPGDKTVSPFRPGRR